MNFEKIYSILIEILEQQENVKIKVDIERKWWKMIDGIYSIITAEEVLLGFSVFINLGLFINYIDKKINKKGGKKYVYRR